MIDIRTLTTADIPLLMQFKQEAGWNQTEDDIRRFLALEPEGCFVAERAGHALGTVAAWAFGPVAWIGMMLVRESERGQGIGTALMRHALAWLESRDVQTIRLDATPMGRPVYEKLGFVEQFQLTRFGGTPHPQSSIALERYLPSDLDDVLALDRQVTSTDRRKLITRLFNEQPEETFVVRAEESVIGFATLRTGSNATQVGPCAASDSAAGKQLLSGILSRLSEQPVIVDIPLPHTAALEIVSQAGLAPTRELTRMNRGPEVLEQIDMLWASSGAEKG